MAGNPLTEFADFVAATGPVSVTTPKGLVMEAVKHTYYFGRLARGDMHARKMLQGGENIEFSIVFQDNGTFEEYEPGAPHDWKNVQVLEKGTAHWRFQMAHMAWTDQELLLNKSVTEGQTQYKFQAFVDLRDEKEQVMWVTVWNGLENQLWAVPNKSKMEGSGSGKISPYSLVAFINEDDDGLFGKPHLAAADTWTTIEGFDPTDADLTFDGIKRWVRQKETYSVGTAGNADNITAAFDRMRMQVEWRKPATHGEYFENEQLNKQMIVTSLQGRSRYMRLLRSEQDHFVAGPQDPAYPDPQFQGIPVVRVDTFENGAYYDDGSGGLTTELASAVDADSGRGPRFMWINGNYIWPVFQKQRYFYKDYPSRQHNVPDTWVCPLQIWYNNVATSLMRQGIVSPEDNTNPYSD